MDVVLTGLEKLEVAATILVILLVKSTLQINVNVIIIIIEIDVIIVIIIMVIMSFLLKHIKCIKIIKSQNLKSEKGFEGMCL